MNDTVVYVTMSSDTTIDAIAAEGLFCAAGLDYSPDEFENVQINFECSQGEHDVLPGDPGPVAFTISLASNSEEDADGVVVLENHFLSSGMSLADFLFFELSLPRLECAIDPIFLVAPGNEFAALPLACVSSRRGVVDSLIPIFHSDGRLMAFTDNCRPRQVLVGPSPSRVVSSYGKEKPIPPRSLGFGY